MEKKNIFAPLFKGLGATRRAAVLLFVMMLTTATAWAQDPAWLKQGDSWDETTKTLTVNTATVFSAAYQGNSQIENVIISNDVTSIGVNAFNGCTNLKTVFVGNSVTSIGAGAFYNCANLKTVFVGNGVTSIGDQAFNSCTSLKTVIMTRTSSSPQFGHAPFYQSPNLKIYVPVDNNGNILPAYRQPAWMNYYNNNYLVGSWSSGTCAAAINNGVLTVVGIGALEGYLGPNSRGDITSVVIEEGVTSIGESAFNNCVNLASITVDANNQTFDSREGCNAIIRKTDNALVVGCKNTVIPNSVTSIGNQAFYGCGGLTTVSIPDGVTSIGVNAFYRCANLESVNIGSGVTSIGEYAFDDCDNLVSITVDANNQTFDSREGCNAIIRKTDNALVTGCKTTIIPDGVQSIGDQAFWGNDGLTSITIPASVTSIGKSAFYWCTGLSTVTIGSGVTSIGNFAFESCHALESVTIYAPSCTLGEIAFDGCDKLANIYVFSNLVDTYKAAENWSAYSGKITAMPVVIADIPDQTYTGSEITPEPTVIAGSLSLTKGTDYVYSYTNNTNVGTAKVRATFQGDYESLGYVEKEFKIVYPTVTTSYVDASGTLHENVVAIPLINTMTTLPAGTYVVNSDVAYTSGITTTGDVTLILGDDCTLSFGKDEQLNGTIIECQSHNLNIYGQSGGTGWLKAYSAQYNGIHVNNYTQYSGNVVIRDGFGACIYANNSVTLLGGTLDVESQGGAESEIIAQNDISILGGKMWAREKGLKTMNGKITLGYTKPTDEIYVIAYDPQDGLQIADGQTLVDDGGNIWSGTLSNDDFQNSLLNKTLRPVMGVVLTKDGSGNISAEFDGTSLETVSIPVNITVNSVTLNRTFTHDKCATLMLPFSLSDGQSLNGGILYKFDGVNNGEGDWVATLSEFTSPLKANTPYLIKPNGHMTDDKITFDLNGGTVTLNTTTAGEDSNEKDDLWDFIGTYSYIKWTSDTGDQDYSTEREAEIGKVYGFAAVEKTGIHVGDFVRVASGAKIRPMCAYLKWKGSIPNNARALTRAATNDDTELPQRITVKLVSASGETTAIGTLSVDNGQLTIDNYADADDWYDLQGRKLSGKPTKKGLYINNGKKIVIK